MTRRRSDIIRELADREREAEENVACQRATIRLRDSSGADVERWRELNAERNAFVSAFVAIKERITALESELGYVRREG